jgi:hypothetical protein
MIFPDAPRSLCALEEKDRIYVEMKSAVLIYLSL